MPTLSGPLLRNYMPASQYFTWWLTCIRMYSLECVFSWFDQHFDWSVYGHCLLECVFPDFSILINLILICPFLLLLPLLRNGASQPFKILNGIWLIHGCVRWSVFFMIWPLFTNITCYNFVHTTYTFKVKDKLTIYHI